MIIVGDSLDRYGRPFYGDRGANVVFKDPDVDFAWAHAPAEVVPMEETEADLDGCCDKVATITFGSDVNTPLGDK